MVCEFASVSQIKHWFNISVFGLIATVTRAVAWVADAAGWPILSLYASYKTRNGIADAVEEVVKETGLGAKMISTQITTEVMGITIELFTMLVWILRAILLIYLIRVLHWGRGELGFEWFVRWYRSRRDSRRPEPYAHAASSAGRPAEGRAAPAEEADMAVRAAMATRGRVSQAALRGIAAVKGPGSATVPDPSTRVPQTAPDASTRVPQTSPDDDRLQPVHNSRDLRFRVGDIVRFVYPRGARAHRHRTVRVLEVLDPRSDWNEAKIRTWDPQATTAGGAERIYFQALMTEVSLLKATEDPITPPRRSTPEEGTVLSLADAPGMSRFTPYCDSKVAEPLNDDAAAICFASLVRRAEERVIATHYTIDDPEIVKAYLEARRNEVSVQIVLDRRQATHSSCAHENAVLVALCSAGVEMRTPAAVLGRRMCHQKTLVVDSYICVFGSANMTEYSRDHGYEFSVCCTLPTIRIALENKFHMLWDNGSAFTLDDATYWLSRKTERSRSNSNPAVRDGL